MLGHVQCINETFEHLGFKNLTFFSLYCKPNDVEEQNCLKRRQNYEAAEGKSPDTAGGPLLLV